MCLLVTKPTHCRHFVRSDGRTFSRNDNDVTDFVPNEGISNIFLCDRHVKCFFSLTKCLLSDLVLRHKLYVTLRTAVTLLPFLTDRHTHTTHTHTHANTHTSTHKDRQTDIQSHMKTDRQAHMKTDRQTDRQTTDRQTHRQTERQTDKPLP